VRVRSQINKSAWTVRRAGSVISPCVVRAGVARAQRVSDWKEQEARAALSAQVLIFKGSLSRRSTGARKTALKVSN
jgi:hypothetical protein